MTTRPGSHHLAVGARRAAPEMSADTSVTSCHFGGFVCASLGTELARRRAFARSFNDPAQLRFVESVDGRGWSEAEADAFVSDEMKEIRRRSRAEGKKWINESAVACALTHRDRLLPEALKRDVILCEDDVAIHRDFVRLWQKEGVRSVFRECTGPVLLHYRANSPIEVNPLPVATFGRYAIHRLTSQHIMSGVCYYVNEKTAAAFREAQTPIHSAADQWRRIQKDAGFPDIFLVHPSPCRLSEFASTIGYSSSRLSSSNLLLVHLLRRMHRKIRAHRYRIFDRVSNLP